MYVPADTFNHGWVESAKMYCTVAGWDTEKSGGTVVASNSKSALSLG